MGAGYDVANLLEVGIRKTLGLLLLIAGLFGPTAATCLGQTAEVTHNVNLRSDPSTDNPPIRLLHPPEILNLLEPNKTAGYYHVKTAQGKKGWVWSNNVKILDVTPTPTQTPTPTPASGITATSTPSPVITTGTATPTQEPGGLAVLVSRGYLRRDRGPVGSKRSHHPEGVDRC